MPNASLQCQWGCGSRGCISLVEGTMAILNPLLFLLFKVFFSKWFTFHLHVSVFQYDGAPKWWRNQTARTAGVSARTIPQTSDGHIWPPPWYHHIWHSTDEGKIWQHGCGWCTFTAVRFRDTHRNSTRSLAEDLRCSFIQDYYKS